jgi:hypothetical protein
MLNLFKQKELKALMCSPDIGVLTMILNEGVGSIDVVHISCLLRRRAVIDLKERVFLGIDVTC